MYIVSNQDVLLVIQIFSQLKNLANNANIDPRLNLYLMVICSSNKDWYTKHVFYNHVTCTV